MWSGCLTYNLLAEVRSKYIVKVLSVGEPSRVKINKKKKAATTN